MVNAQGVVEESVQVVVVGNELMVGVSVLVVEVNELEGVRIVMIVEVSELEVEESDDLQLMFLVVVVSEPKVKENDDLPLVFLVVVMVLVSRALLRVLVMVVFDHAHQN